MATGCNQAESGKHRDPSGFLCFIRVRGNAPIVVVLQNVLNALVAVSGDQGLKERKH